MPVLKEHAKQLPGATNGASDVPSGSPTRSHLPLLLGLTPKLASSTETELYETQRLRTSSRSLYPVATEATLQGVHEDTALCQADVTEGCERNGQTQPPSKGAIDEPGRPAKASISRLQWASGPTPILAQMKLNLTCTWTAQGLGGEQSGGGVACPL